MKKTLLIVFILSLGTITMGQISGTKYIPGDYATIAAAVTALNTLGVGPGGVTFDVLPGHTELITTPILITATGTAADPVVFQANAGPVLNPLSNPMVRRTDIGTIATAAVEAQGDAVIIIQGGDNITFDGIDIQATDPGIEYGFFLRRASATNGCKNVTIKNAAITMNKGSVGANGFVIGIYSSNLDENSLVTDAAGLTLTSIEGRTENLLITGNTIGNVHIGIAVRGYSHTTAPNNFQDLNTVIGTIGAGNTIQNYGGSSTASSQGIHLWYQTSANISYNTIDNVAGGGAPATGGLFGIMHQASNNVGNFVASNNTMTFGLDGSAAGTGIQATPPGTTDNTIIIQNNTFAFGTFNGSGTFSLISCTGAKANNITVTGNSTLGSITKTGTGGSVYGYNNASPGASTGGTQTVSNNNFSNFTLEGAGIFYGMDCRSNANLLQTIVITNNVISNIIAGGSARGINQSGGAAGSTVNNNTITNFTNTGGASTGNNSVTGIILGSNSTPVTLTVYQNTITMLRGAENVVGINNFRGTNNRIYRNNIAGLTAISTGIGPVYGMIIQGVVTTYVYNNFISEISAPNATGNYSVIGVYVNAGTNVYLYYNTIYLNAMSTSANFGSAGVYASTSVNFEMRNNIIVNKSWRSGNTGFTVAYHRSSNNLASYSNASDNNVFFVSSNSPIGNYIYCEGSSSNPITAKDSTMADYKTRVAPRDAASYNEDPPFVNVVTTPYDLHILTNVVTHCESGGARIISPIAVTNDYDNDLRWGEPGYTGTGTAPDIGADEFGIIIIPMSLDALATNAECPGSSDGAINLTVSGGTPPFTYLWSNGATSEDLTGLVPGTYSVTVTDFTSLQASGSWIVGQNSMICNNSTVSGTASSTNCYNALQTLTVSGLTVTSPNGHVELIAGEKIVFLPGTVVQSGAYLWGHISTTFCTQPNSPMVSAGTGAGENLPALSNTWFTLYPNPTSGSFTIIQKGEKAYESVKVEVYSMNGTRVLTGRMIGDKSHEFSASALPTGIYFVRVVADQYVETIKLIKTR